MNSRIKGKRGELEWRDVLRDLGFTNAQRGQQRRGGVDSPDVIGGIPGTHPEVKRVERLNVDSAMQQAIRDSAGVRIPYVAHRRNHRPWLVTVQAHDLTRFARHVLEIAHG